MRLTWFEVQSYKNFRDPLRLVDLGRFNVLHGDNNVGKSNLIETIGLFFVLLQAVREEGQSGPSLEESYARGAPLPEAGAAQEVSAPPREIVLSSDYLTRRGFSPEDIFNVQEAGPIHLSAQVRLDQDDLEKEDPPWLKQPVTVHLRLEHAEEQCAATITRLTRDLDGADLAGGKGDAVDKAFSLALDRLGSRHRGGALEPRFALIRAAPSRAPRRREQRRSRRGSRCRAISASRCMTPRRARYAARRQPFLRFVEALGRFRDLIGEGQWRMRFLPKEDRAELVLDRGSASPPLPLRLMGSGIQQLAVLCARIALTRADLAEARSFEPGVVMAAALPQRRDRRATWLGSAQRRRSRQAPPARVRSPSTPSPRPFTG